MKILSVDSSSQSFTLTPRFLSTNQTLELYNEDTRVLTTFVSGVNLTASVLNVVALTLSFTYAVTNNQTFRIKLINTDNSEILWRGKAFATSQETQNYKINV